VASTLKDKNNEHITLQKDRKKDRKNDRKKDKKKERKKSE
jgi:hypothetical protein